MAEVAELLEMAVALCLKTLAFPCLVLSLDIDAASTSMLMAASPAFCFAFPGNGLLIPVSIAGTNE